jgi:hypothetical protein
MKRIDGVESVKVSLESGVADVELAPGNGVTIEKLRKAITDNGFTPKDAEATLAGKIVVDKGKPQLAVSGSEATYPLAAAPGKNPAGLVALAGKPVVLTAQVPATRGKETPTLAVKELKPGR